jgi:endonuclease-8
MPEGDTIFRTARTLERALGGRAVTAFDSVLAPIAAFARSHPIVGRTVVAVRSAGKHLLIEFSGGTVLRTHLRMNGQWHVYRPGERWRRSRAGMRIVIGTAEWVAVGFNVPVAEFVEARDLPRHPVLSRLGPDLLAPEVDVQAVAARLREAEGTVEDALLDQRVMAGVGNVFKSEVLFLCGIDPFRPARSLSEEEAMALVGTARRLLQANVLDPALPARVLPPYRARTTTRSLNPGTRLWAYGRGGRRCLKCGSAIHVRRQGASVRLTYWCRRCQR